MMGVKALYPVAISIAVFVAGFAIVGYRYQTSKYTKKLKLYSAADSLGQKHNVPLHRSEISPQPLPNPIRLLRIPKAGSSSTSAFLRLQYNCTSEKYPPGDCNKYNTRACPAIKGCTSHHNQYHLKSDMPFVTVVRDPVQQYISAYNYPGHHGKGTDGDILLHIQLFPEWNNTQTTFLAGKPIGTWQSQGENNPRTTPVPKALLSLAEQQERLQIARTQIQERAAFVGLLEYWTDSMRLFCRSWECPQLEDGLAAQKERVNPNQIPSLYPDSTLELIRQVNANDETLYQASRQRYCGDLLSFRNDKAFWASISEKSKSMCHKLPKG